jgi:diadenosine tetraphosphate (Ap4A) HIT family hydrolase
MCGLVDAFPRDVRVLATSRHAIAVLSRYQLRRGHVLVLARRHVERWSDVAWNEWRDVQRLSWEAARAIERAFDPVRVYAATLGANGKVAPTSFPHLHVHVVPIYESDERGKPSNVFTWKHGLVKPSSREAAAVQRALVDAWRSKR